MMNNRMNNGALIDGNRSSRNTLNLDRILRHILNGGVAAVPTETVYGLLADALSSNAVEKVRNLKGKSDSIPIFVPDDLSLIELAVDPGGELLLLEKEFWPGPLMFIVDASEIIAGLPVTVTNRIGVRKSGLRLIGELVRKTGRFLTATSANRSGAPPTIKASEVKKTFGDTDLLIMEEIPGFTPDSRPSTVIERIGDDLVIRREGAITAEQIKRVLYREGFKKRIVRSG